MKRFMEENRRYLELLVVTIIILGFFVSIMIRADRVAAAFGGLINVLKPFIYGFVIAYLLKPVVDAVEKAVKAIFEKLFHKKVEGCRGASIAITFIIVLVVITLMFCAIIPGLITSIKTLIVKVPRSLREFEYWLRALIGEGLGNEIVASFTETIENAYEHIYDSIQKFLLPNLENIVSQVAGGFGGMLGVLKNVIIGCVVAIYMLASWEKFGAQARIMLYGLVSEKPADWIYNELKLTNSLFGGFISGKLVDSAIIGVICFVVCMLLNMPYALLVSVIVGITNIIPFFGPYLGAVPSAILILTESPYKCVVFIVFIIILQQIDGNVIGPKILGDKIGVSSFWILFAILFFGSYWGVIGMIVGVPLFGVIYDLAKRIIHFGLKKHGREDMMEDYIREFQTDSEEDKDKEEKKKNRFSELLKKKKGTD
ncbi:MAG: AI-2E family transporter [Lachnospiraceae bacterium]|nr:AI-2E family transporter [Lachnospiraceae bacterium]